MVYILIHKLTRYTLKYRNRPLTLIYLNLFLCMVVVATRAYADTKIAKFNRLPETVTIL